MKRLGSMWIVIALVVCFSGVSVYGQAGSDSNAAVERKESSPKPGLSAPEPKANAKVKADVLKLVSDAKAGKLKMPAQQFPQPKRNNLSKGAKIAIAAGIAGVIIFIILWYTTGPGSD